MDLRYLNTKYFHCHISSNEAMSFQKKNADFKKILRYSSKIKRGIGHHLRAFGPKGLYIIMQNILCKNLVELLL